MDLPRKRNAILREHQLAESGRSTIIIVQAPTGFDGRRVLRVIQSRRGSHKWEVELHVRSAVKECKGLLEELNPWEIVSELIG